MTQSLHAEDGSLPQCLTVQNAYTELHSGSKNVTVVVRNSMAYLQTIRKSPVVRAATVTQVPEPSMQANVKEMLEEAHGLQAPRLTIRQRQEKVFKELDLSGFESWTPELVDSAQPLMAEYHDNFLSEPSELECTLSTKHVIKVTDKTPFKE